MKKLITTILVFTMLFSALFMTDVNAVEESEYSKITSAEETDQDDFVPFSTSGDWKYVVDEKGNVSIIGYTGKKSDLTIPEKIDGHTVTQVIALSDPFKNINYESPVTIVRIGKTVTSLSQFRELNNLNKISVSKKNKHFATKNGILYNKDMTKLLLYPRNHTGTEFKIAKTVKVLGEDSVTNNENLTKVVIPSCVRKIEAGAFCSSKVQKVVISKNVRLIGEVAFWKCKYLQKLIFKTKKAITVYDEAFAETSSLKQVTLPLMNDNSGGDMFESSGLTKVIVPKNIRRIPGRCFLDCKKLKTIEIPSNVKVVGKKSVGYKWGNYIIERNNSFIIKGKKGSAAEKYAKANKLKFKAI